jgi:hypothetical protein
VSYGVYLGAVLADVLVEWAAIPGVWGIRSWIQILKLEAPEAKTAHDLPVRTYDSIVALAAAEPNWGFFKHR